MQGTNRRLVGLDNEVRPYPWGSRTHIPQLLGVQPSGEPEAEMWIGAHPGSPSRVADSGQTLLALIDADPEALLGAAVVSRFGPALPFLLKLLAAEKPLSLQTHPTIHQAREGYQAEDDEGVPLDAAHRSYTDRNHKPELLCPLTPFEALCGFRPVHDSAEFLRAAADAGAQSLSAVADRLVADGGLRDVVTWLLTLPAMEQSQRAVAAAAACAKLAAGDGPWAAEARAIVRLGELYPDDAGVVLAMLLNHVRLQPGEAIYLAAGQIHTYLHGFGVEVMASSDNVMRAGLTGKHVNVPELLRTVDFADAPIHAIAPVEQESGEQRYLTPAPDFALTRIELGTHRRVELANVHPSIVVCVEGSARVSVQDESLELGPGRSAFIAAGSDVSLQGDGLVFRATVGWVKNSEAIG